MSATAVSVSRPNFLKKSLERSAQLQRLSRLPAAHDRNNSPIDSIVEVAPHELSPPQNDLTLSLLQSRNSADQFRRTARGFGFYSGARPSTANGAPASANPMAAPANRTPEGLPC
jgi:hypothetical protein